MSDIPLANVAVHRYTRETLIDFSQNYLQALGASQEDAAIISDGIVTAASRWHPGKGQGLEKLFRLTLQFENGGINPNAEFEILKETPAVALVDANKGAGYVTGTKAMRLAIQKAREVGTGCVVVRHSNHFGQAGYHAETATREGMIGVAMTNAAAEMAPWGAKNPVLGTNPWGLGIPRKDNFPILLDMALTMSGQGMVAWAYREGVKIPPGWVQTLDGEKSLDPADYIAEDGRTFVGTQLPIGEFKGYGLSLFTDIVTGVMGGSLFGTTVFKDLANHDVGHLFQVWNPETFMEREEFQQRVEQLVEEVKSAEPIDADQGIYLPGELEFLREQSWLEEGIPIDHKSVEKLRSLAEERGVACPL
jgi:LDH2 family malate/lactate/ureidoglycolate dehydrogenase